MSNRPTPEHYRPAQIILHWVVVVGFITQMAIHESIVRVYTALGNGDIPDSLDNILAWVHVGTGTTILVAVLARLYLRYRYGAPGHAPGTPPTQAKIADIMHRTLYLLLIAMALTGMVTWNGLMDLGDIHFYINVVLFFLVLGHAGAAIHNQFVRKDGTLQRMWFSRSKL
ncbi:MAG: cytochrome b [Granulosicoccus sp.]